MKTLVTIAIGAFLAALLAGCLPAATDQEIARMCENLVKLRGEVDLVPIDKRISEIDEEMAARKADIEKSNASTLAGLSADLQAKLAELGEKATAEDRAKVEQENAAKTTEAEAQKAEALARIEPDREARVVDARKKAEEARASAAASIEECTKKAKDEGVTQKLAECRIQAGTTDKYWNLCH
ncbi:MAG TPA: hypothetical protein VM285_01090 [Polyangia bacterium]|nr:hypothetical protein [Polyangia bacterium]